MNLDIWAFEETSAEATRALVDYLHEVYHLDFACEFSEPDAPSEKQTTAVMWNQTTVDGRKEPWPDEINEWLQVRSEDFDGLNLEAVEGKVFDRYPQLYHFANKGGQDFDFYLVPLHLKAMGEGSKRRRMAAAILGAAIDKMINQYGADGDWVVGGDFNASLASDDFSKLISGGMVPLSAADEEGGAFSYVKGPKSLIDHIFLSPNLAETYGAKDYFIVAQDKVIPDFVTALSDHRPVLVRLSLKDNQPHREGVNMRDKKPLTDSLSDRLSVLDLNAGVDGARPSRAGAEKGETQLSVPLTVTLSGGEIRLSARISAQQLSALLPKSSGVVEEAVSIDPDYSRRRGYDPNFLGSGARKVPLPQLSGAMKSQAATNKKATGADKHVLPYHHYSVVMNKVRKLAFFTAVNIDGNIFYNIKREEDKWFYDPRLEKNEQTGNDVYANNPLDRGHLVRRLDPAWGESKELAKIANDDTFHFTNCTPQHHDFNAGKTLWAGLEDYILKNADALDFKVSVFTGPVLDDKDDDYRGVKLPRQFWKVVAMVKEDGKLSATAYLLSQAELLQGVGDEAFAPEDKEAFSYGAYKTFQVPVRRVEKLTGLSFGNLSNYDPQKHLESSLEALESLDADEVMLGAFEDIKF
jgi:DNA/RNA endonuclease G (NUC1)